MFLFFSDNLGCAGSLIVSAVVTLVLLLLFGVIELGQPEQVGEVDLQGVGKVAQGPPLGVDRPGFDLAQPLDRHLGPLGELFLGQAGVFPQPADCPP